MHLAWGWDDQQQRLGVEEVREGRKQEGAEFLEEGEDWKEGVFPDGAQWPQEAEWEGELIITVLDSRLHRQ